MPLIVGLGNPGSEYDGTPHNIGFEVIAKLAQKQGLKFRRSAFANAEETKIPASDPPVILLRPLSYMNLSGGPVRSALNFYKLSASDLLIVCDDANIPLGHLRFREKGGAGGQKGLLSVINTVGTNDFPRLRLGVGGGRPGANLSDYVLSKYSKADRIIADETIELASEAVNCFLEKGLSTAMNKFNTKKESINPSDGPESSD